MKPRQVLIALALGVTLAAALWPRPEEEVVEAVARSAGGTQTTGTQRTRRPTTPAETPPQLGALRANLFPAQTWRPPPPPPPKVVPLPPPPPMAPPLPFQYLGRWQEEDKEVIFLAQGSRVLHARVGDTLAGWHLDQASESALTFTWTALNMRQILRIAP